jgi:pimeloyl-ACP methyl ester carboxylesterase
MWDMLQIGFQEVRSRWEMCGVIAEGTGCAAALALACQLPVDGIVLIDPTLPVWDPFGREQAAVRPEMVQARKMARRFAAFARRNLALCVGDMLIVSHGCMDSSRALRRAFGNPANCRVSRLYVGDESAKELYTIREFDVKAAISRFLLHQEASKPLAENPEMCIIYG